MNGSRIHGYFSSSRRRQQVNLNYMGSWHASLAVTYEEENAPIYNDSVQCSSKTVAHCGEESDVI